MSSDTAIVSGVRSLWEEDHLQDYTIQVEGRSFKVHKLILAAVSDYFRAMLTGGMAESGTDCVKLGVVSAGAVEVLIDFIYRNRMRLTETNVADVLSAAVYLQIPSAIEVCTKYMVDNLSTETCFNTHTAFLDYSFPEETEDVESFIKANMEAMVNEGDKKLMPYTWLCYLLDKCRGSELKLFQFAYEWVQADIENRKEHLVNIMAKIRFCLFTLDELEHVKTLKMFQEGSDTWRKFANEAVDYHNLPIHKKVLNDSVQNTVRTPPAPTCFTAELPQRNPFFMPDCPVIDYDKLDLDFYVMAEEKHWTVCDFPMPQYCGKVYHHLEVNNFLICTTSRYSDMPYHFLVFDPRTLNWCKLTTMDVQKESYTLLYHEQHLYVIGGTLDKGGTLTDSIERYSFLTGTWSHFTTLPYPQYLVLACVYHDCIYITGGRKDKSFHEEGLHDVDCLNLATLVWETKAPAKLEYQFDLFSLFVMTLHGEEVLCIMDRRMQLGYYTTASNQWTNFKYPIGPDFPWYDDGSVIITGNTIYYFDHFEYGHWKNKGICMELTFPEKGTEVVVNDLYHFLRLGYHYPRAVSAMLSIPADKITADIFVQGN